MSGTSGAGGIGGLHGTGGAASLGGAPGGTAGSDGGAVDAAIDAGATADVGSGTGEGGICQRSDQCVSGNCSNSTCCAMGWTGCGGGMCSDLTHDSAHCGTCSITCPAGTQACTGGHCLLIDGQPCTIGAACTSAVCSPFYVDADKDTYGTNVTIGLCGVSPPPGYATRPGDCCDSNATSCE